MTGSGDEMATGGRGPQRASDADREQVVDTLKTAFVQGRLAKEEFDLRVGQVLASRTYADLDLLTADIPAGPAKAQPPEPTGTPANRKFIARATVAVGGGAMLVTDAMLLPRYPVAGLVGGVFVGAFAAALMAGLLTFLSWALSKTSGNPPPSTHQRADTRSAAPAADPVRRPPYTLATAAS